MNKSVISIHLFKEKKYNKNKTFPFSYSYKMKNDLKNRFYKLKVLFN